MGELKNKSKNHTPKKKNTEENKLKQTQQMTNMLFLSPMRKPTMHSHWQLPILSDGVKNN